MTWASRLGRPGGAPWRIHANTSASSAYAPYLPSPGDLRLEPGQQPEALRVALEPAAWLGHVGQGGLAVVPERRVAEVVCQARGVDQVGIAAQGTAQFPADLGAFQRVGEPGPREVP